MKRIFFGFAFFIISFSLFSQSQNKEKDLLINFEFIQSQFNGRSGPINFSINEYDPNMLFHLEENNVISDEVKRENPGLKTYFILEHNSIVGSFTYFENGFWLDYNHKGKLISIYPDFEKGAHGASKIQVERKPIPFGMCGTDHGEKSRKYDLPKNLNRAGLVNKLTYRMAIVATGEFYLANGGTPASSAAAIAASVNGISAIYARQLGIFFNLIGSFSYPDPATDPFTPDDLPNAPSRPEQAGIEVPKKFATANYDIGHVLHKHSTGDNWSTGGVARLASVCDNGLFNGQLQKASAWSGSFNTSGFDWHSLFAHEVGHQFSMTHTFNGTGDSCTDAIQDDNAVEIGSGTTIMSYNGLCLASNNTPSNGGEADNYFHYNSFNHAMSYIANEIPSCANPVPIQNNHPAGNFNPCSVTNYKMPKSTPFYLKGSATDMDNDQILYAWDQFDEDGNGTPTQGSIGTNAGNKVKAPLFKSIPPSPINERYFPNIGAVVNGNNSDPFQALPNVARVLSFAFSARDNKPIGGGIYYEPKVITVDATGPLQVTFPNFAETFTTGQATKIKWNTNGSDALCSKVGIYLSIDGGITYPITLAKDVAYDSDSVAITIPGFLTNTTTARVKIACDDYDCFKFFDISDANFTVNSVCAAPSSIICPTNNLSFDKGSPSLQLAMKKVYGNSVTKFSKRILNNSPITKVIVNNTNNNGCAIKPLDSRSISTIISVSKTGTYSFAVDFNFNNGFGFVTIVKDDGFSSNNACNFFVASSASDGGGNSVSASSSMSATLEECTNYRIFFYNFETFPINTVISAVSGPGLVFEQPTTQPADYGYTYIAVRKSNNIIAAVNSTADFRTLGPGLYTICGMSQKTSGPTPPNNTDFNNYLGKEFNSFYIADDCFLSSVNSFELEVKGSCALESASLGAPAICNPNDNTYTQNVTLAFSTSPGGKVSVGGQLFDITTSPQTVVYKGTNSNGLAETIEAFFVSEADCKYTLSIQAPKNCCPIESGVESEIRGCQGQPVTIEAKPGQGTYKWTDGAGMQVSTDNKLTTSAAGKYILTITTLTGCAKSQDVNVTFEATPTVSLPADATICDGVQFQIVANSTATFLEWYKNDTLVQSGPNKTLSVSTKGTYKVKAGNSVLCQVQDDIIITTKPSPKPSLGIDKEICEGNSTTLSTTENGTITWFLDNVPISGQSSKTITVKDQGVYKILVQGANSCEGQDVINVNVVALPNVEAGPDLKFCDGKDATVVATASTQNYQWFKDGQPYSAIDLNFTTTAAGKYKIVVQNTAGCKVADSLIIVKNPLPVVNLGADKVGCLNSDIMLAGPAGTGLKYQWLKNGVNTATTQQLTVNSPATYTLIVTDANTCSNTDMIDVDFKPGPSVTLNEQAIEICEGEAFDLIATTTATKIEWLKNNVKITGQTGKTLNVTQAGTYTIKATGVVTGGTSECTVEQMATAVVNPKLSVSVNDTTACEGESITLTSNVTAPNYKWTLNGVALASTKTFKPSAAGTYILEVTTNKGCKSSDAAIVTFSSRPSINIPATGQYCKGETLDVKGNSNGTKFVWRKNNAIVPNATSKDFVITSPGTYVIEASFNGACPKKDTIVVEEKALPIVSLGNDITLCPGDSIKLDAKNNGNKYKWSTGDTSQTVTIKNVGVAKESNLNVTVTNQFGCKATDDIKVSSLAKIKIKLTSSAPGVCGGDSVVLTVSGGNGYKWTGPNNTFKILSPDKIVVFPSTNSIYKVESSDDCPSNRDTASKEIKLFTLPKVSAGNDTCVVKGRTIKLKATGGASYVWNADPTIVKGINTASPEIGPIDSTTYKVTIKDANGCLQYDSVSVCIIDDPLSLIKEINMITPNSDGKNDFLEFKGLEAFPDNSLIVYNRWGNIVFEKSRYQQDSERFEGLRNGEDLPADTYYYVLTFDQVVIKQSLTILRDRN